MNYNKKYNIDIYDNKGKTLDPITVVFNNTKSNKYSFTNKPIRYNYECLGISQTGFGYFQHSECTKGKHLGTKIDFKDLHVNVQNMLHEYFKPNSN